MEPTHPQPQTPNLKLFHLIFATNNPNKVAEVQAIIPPNMRIQTLQEAGIDINIPEPHHTLEANALEKAEVIYKLTAKDCFSEDTGLEVAAINGEPGVRSARYAGEPSDAKKNIEKLLLHLKPHSNKKARFRTVIVLMLNGEPHFFEGICTGAITDAPRGGGGFGYDPVFVPDGSDRTFAEMTMEEKSFFSHRKKAVAQLAVFLNALSKQF